MHRRTRLVLALLSACAGGMDILALVALGGVFTGSATGDIIRIGHGVGTCAWRVMATAGVALTGFALGVWIWARFLGTPEAVSPRALLLGTVAELLLLITFAVGWVLTEGQPSTHGVAPALLFVGALAMGAQSSVSMTLGGSTTFMTGVLANAIAGLATKAPPRRTLSPLIQPAALLVGVILTTLAFTRRPELAALLPLGFATLAVLAGSVGRRRR
ncbi:DUF1275 domain-containing protein [Spiractinospora alimapuensis]|uniref:YoaK family protein n=1 Tax=Spiractinospora alimapuensis TaxID=2820884 RepID=UPI001F28A6E6|nr:YoaK family protein [Spiractinospora alimapuensis]QVQ52754.1 DUF1275 domain-containing protein [Spiractinospora alimapuensis]